MDKEKCALELVRAMLDDGSELEFTLGIRDSETGQHFLVSVRPHKPKRVEELLESVLYPSAATVCKICGK